MILPSPWWIFYYGVLNRRYFETLKSLYQTAILLHLFSCIMIPEYCSTLNTILLYVSCSLVEIRENKAMWWCCKHPLCDWSDLDQKTSGAETSWLCPLPNKNTNTILMKEKWLLLWTKKERKLTVPSNLDGASTTNGFWPWVWLDFEIWTCQKKTNNTFVCSVEKCPRITQSSISFLYIVNEETMFVFYLTNALQFPLHCISNTVQYRVK